MRKKVEVVVIYPDGRDDWRTSMHYYMRTSTVSSDGRDVRRVSALTAVSPVRPSRYDSASPRRSPRRASNRIHVPVYTLAARRHVKPSSLQPLNHGPFPSLPFQPYNEHFGPSSQRSTAQLSTLHSLSDQSQTLRPSSSSAASALAAPIRAQGIPYCPPLTSGAVPRYSSAQCKRVSAPSNVQYAGRTC